jgi:hypothetical protein
VVIQFKKIILLYITKLGGDTIMTFDAYDIDAALIKELFADTEEDFIFVNELTGEEIYIDNKTRRMKKKKKQFEEAIKNIKL